MKKKKNAFTLIELLAIIVILAIIAVITVPIILNIIENSKKGAAQDSAYGYKDAIEKYYVAQLYDNKEIRLEGNYNIENGVLIGNSLPEEGVQIPIEGTIPTSGYLKYENNKLKEGCLVVGEYASTFTESKITKVEKGACTSSTPTPQVETVGPVNEKCEYNRLVAGTYYTTPECVKDNPVFYNPNTAQACTEEEYNSNNPTPTTGIYKKEGCMKWYAYSKNDNTLNMILDHNTTAEIEWVKGYNASTQTDYTEGASVGITYPENYVLFPYGSYYGEYYSGPVTALKQLKIDTSNWSDKLLRKNDSYTLNKTDASGFNVNYTIDYSAYKAKLISFEEIGGIIGNIWNLDVKNNGETTSKFSWLYDYTGLEESDEKCSIKGCEYDANSSNETFGFWTSDANTDDTMGPYSIFHINYDGTTTSQLANEYSGIRPVITVPIASE